MKCYVKTCTREATGTVTGSGGKTMGHACTTHRQSVADGLERVMIAKPQEEFDAERPERVGAAPATEEVPYGRVPDYRLELVRCDGCDVPLTADEYQPDYDLDDDRYVFCGRRECDECWKEKKIG